MSVVVCGRPAGQPAGCSAREGARALPFAGGGTGGPSSHWLFPGARLRLGTLAAVDRDLIERTVARLHEQEPTFDWVGVYWLEADTLVLGPFRGAPTEHDRIAVGQGVCGAVAATGQTEIVPDVRRRPGHIACDVNTRSEVVVPIIRDGVVLGVLDVDSNTLDAFGERGVALVQDAARVMAAQAEVTA